MRFIVLEIELGKPQAYGPFTDEEARAAKAKRIEQITAKLKDLAKGNAGALLWMGMTYPHEIAIVPLVGMQD